MARTIALEVPGFLPAVLVVPAGDERRPLLVAAHGAGGAPEWECEYWKQLTEAEPFVLCLRGTAMGRGSFYYKDHHALGDELTAATRAARRAFARIAPSGSLYAGFSQGASMGSLALAAAQEHFSYVVLIEGFEQWDARLSRSFREREGRAVLLVCGTGACASKAGRSAEALHKAGLRARAEHAEGAGHTPLGGVLSLVKRELTWLLADDPLWQQARPGG
jgi:predicted esterase